MKASYADIRQLTSEPPVWFDENGVPRYCAFAPELVADIYADEAALVDLACQSCGARFQVAMSRSVVEVTIRSLSGYSIGPLAENIKAGLLHYGDPPNVGCCHAGSSMTGEALRVLEFWTRQPDWVRVPALEVVLDADAIRRTDA